MYDILLHALRLFPKNSSENLVVIVSKALHDNLGAARVEDIQEEIGKTKVAVVALDDSMPEEFLEFISKSGHFLVKKMRDAKQSFEELRKKYFF